MTTASSLPTHQALGDAPHPKRIMNVVAAVLGNTLEFYDFTVYAAFATMLGRSFFPSTDAHLGLLLTVATFGLGFFVRPLGGVLIGAYADRYGRKPAMTMTILMMAFGTGMIGLLPTYAQIGIFAPILLVVARLLQGFSTGGEMGPATTFLIESAPRDRQCLYGSWQFASQNAGTAISGILGVILAFTLPLEAMGDWGWRIPFLLGIIIAPVGFYIRQNLDETLEKDQALGSMSAVLSDLFRFHWRQVVLCVMLICGGTITQYFFIYGATFAIATLGFSARVGMIVSMTTGLFGLVFALVGGWLGDIFGVKAVALVPRILTTLLVYPAMLLVISVGSPVLFVAVMAGLMAVHAISTACAILMIPRIFPAAIRTSGLAISYALSVSFFGGTAQFVFTWIIGLTGDKLSWIWYLVVAGLISVIGTILIRVPDDLPELDETERESIDLGPGGIAGARVPG